MYERIDTRFGDLIIGHAKVEQLWTGGRWLEGPVYWPDADMLVFSDIPNNRILRWVAGSGSTDVEEAAGTVSLFRRPSRFANGNTRDPEGRLVTCEHGSRRVTRTEHNGEVAVLADRVAGKRFNSPNDVVVKSDGSVWFSDPDYGIRSDYEGHRAASELDGCNVYRLSPDGEELSVAATGMVKPNGLAFSVDERTLYVSDSGRTADDGGPPHIRRFSVDSDNTLSDGGVFAAVDSGVSDGFRVDEYDNIWTSAGDGVHCFAPDGTLLGKIPVPETVSNVAFGGPNNNHLFMTATTSLYSVYLAVRGARRW
jgi:gluconolactonase